jgi:hypothetical protein
MREFTRSVTSYTWAMSMFGVQQMINVFRPGRGTDSFNNVTKAAEAEFDDALKATFRAGDNLQRGLVDMTFGVLTLGMFDRGGARASCDVARQTGEAFRQGGRLVNETVDAFSRTAQAGASAVTGAAQQTAQSTGFNDQTQSQSYASSSRSSTRQ